MGWERDVSQTFKIILPRTFSVLLKHLASQPRTSSSNLGGHNCKFNCLFPQKMSGVLSNQYVLSATIYKKLHKKRELLVHLNQWKCHCLERVSFTPTQTA